MNPVSFITSMRQSTYVSFVTFTCPGGDALQALSLEQLQQLEGMERANVEARLSLLRDVQKLLDSAVLRLNQYTTVMAAVRWVW